MPKKDDFEGALNDLLSEWHDRADPDEIISALELAMMALKEEQD